MAMSGISVSDEIVEKYALMKSHKFKYIFMKIASDDKTVEIDTTMAADKELKKEKDEECFKTMCSSVMDDKEPRFVLYDMQNETSDGRIIEKIIFIFWCSDSAPIKKKMTYAATKDSVIRKLEGIAKSFQASDKGDLDYQEYLKIVIEKK